MSKEKKLHTFQAVIQSWEESERGWGTEHEGYSVHLTEQDYKEFLKEFLEDEKRKNPSGTVPEVYTRPVLSNPKKVLVTQEMYKKLILLKACAEYGIRFWNKDEFTEV